MLDVVVEVALVLKVVLEVEIHNEPRCVRELYVSDGTGRYVEAMDSSLPGRTEMVEEGGKKHANAGGVASVGIVFTRKQERDKFVNLGTPG